MLEGEHGVLRKEFEKLTSWLGGEPPPDVVNLPNSLLIGMAAPLRRALGAPICCTLQGEELFLDGLVEPYRGRARQLIHEQIGRVDRFIAVSEYCAGFMSGYLGFKRELASVVPLGINMDGYEMRRPDPETFRIGYFARIAPEKGLKVLAEAYVQLRRRTADARIRLEIAGGLSPVHQPYLDSVRALLDKAGLSNEYAYRGTLDRDAKLRFLRGLDVLSVPATYDEPKGLFLLEAMASGVPVVQPRRGAFTEVIEKTGGGLLVEPDDPASLADALYSLWVNRELVDTLGRSAGTKTFVNITAPNPPPIDCSTCIPMSSGGG